MDKYVFNWNIILAHCPEYKKYLVDTNRLKDDAEEDVISEITRSNDMFGHRTGEELEVMRQMGNGATGSTGWGMQRLEEMATPKNDTIHYMLKPKYENPSLIGKMNPLQLPPPKSVLDVGSELNFPSTNRSGWHMNYQVTGNAYKDSSVDLTKTKVNETDDKIQLVKAVYWFDQKKNVIGDRSGRFTCLTYNKKTKNLYYTSRRLKSTTARRTSKRYVSQVQGILLNKMILATATISVPRTILISFVNIVEKAVFKDVPEAYVPTQPLLKPHKPRNSSGYKMVVNSLPFDEKEFLQTKLLALLLQHKANTRLDWLNTNVLSNASKLLALQGFEEQVTGTNAMAKLSLAYPEYLKYTKNEHRRRVRKVVPTLKAGRSLKSLTKSVCGEFYAKILSKLISTVDLSTQSLVDVMKILHYGRMPKFLYHWLSNLLNNGIEGQEVLESVILQILNTIGDLNVTNERERERNITILELWVKTCKRFLRQNGFINTWFTWRDMYNMADRMNIRLRPNKFKDEVDVKHQHDLLSELTNRDVSMLQDYADITFREFTVPDKEYDGFTFVQLQTADDLVHEGKTMHHCVGGYADRCVSGHSIIFSMRKGDRGYVTIELSGKALPYHVHQQYSIDDVHVTNESALALINKWLKDINELHKEDTVSYAQECKNIDNTLKAEHGLEKLMGLKGRANEDILPYINSECAKLEQQLATLAIETTRIPEPEPEDAPNIVDMINIDAAIY